MLHYTSVIAGDALSLVLGYTSQDSLCCRAGYEASTEWYDQSAASKQKDVLRSRIFGQVYAAVTAPQTEHLARFRLAYFVEHILPLDPDSPSRSSMCLT